MFDQPSSGLHQPEFMTTRRQNLGHDALHVARTGARKAAGCAHRSVSFGVTLYEMATSEMPFHGDTTGVLFLSIVQDTPEPVTQFNPALPAELQRIINKCLERELKKSVSTKRE